jgi:hypothetical protein
MIRVSVVVSRHQVSRVSDTRNTIQLSTDLLYRDSAVHRFNRATRLLTHTTSTHAQATRMSRSAIRFSTDESHRLRDSFRHFGPDDRVTEWSLTPKLKVYWLVSDMVLAATSVLIYKCHVIPLEACVSNQDLGWQVGPGRRFGSPLFRKVHNPNK